MPKLVEPLASLDVRRLAKPGRYAVGEVRGLYLSVADTGARSWVLRTMVAGRRSAIGLGSYPTVTLAQARDLARETLLAIRQGADPAAERRAARKRSAWTFKTVAQAYIEAHRSGWKNAKHAQQWENTLATYVYPKLGAKQVADIGKGDVLAVIEPIWTSKNETATRVRQRIELVLAYATQREYRPDTPNPARWRGNLDMALPKAGRLKGREHFAALPVDELHAFMNRLQAVDGMGARALELAVLTAARSGEVRGARWVEFDLVNAVWTIPAERMKAGREHRVPLNERALALLEGLPRFAGPEGGLLFPGKEGRPISDMTLTAVLRRMRVDATVHGFRSTFRDWAAERTATPHEVAEMALAHAVGDKVEAAYRRGDLFEKRRELMDLWARFIGTAPATGNVRALRRSSGAV